MNWSWQPARQIRRELVADGQITDDTNDAFLGRRGVERCAFPLAGRLRELCVPDFNLIQTDVLRQWRRWVSLHAIAYLELHTGNHLYLARSLPWLKRRRERQAQECAGWILYDELPAGPWIVPILAAQAGVPPECVERWLRITRGDE